MNKEELLELSTLIDGIIEDKAEEYVADLQLEIYKGMQELLEDETETSDTMKEFVQILKRKHSL